MNEALPQGPRRTDRLLADRRGDVGRILLAVDSRAGGVAVTRSFITRLPFRKAVPVPDRNDDRLDDYYAARGWRNGIDRCYPFEYLRREQAEREARTAQPGR